MRRLRGAGVLLSVLLVVLLPGVAQSAGTISGKIATLSDGRPIAGALVTVAAPDQRPLMATTAANGRFSINVGGSGPYSVGVQATGFAGQSVGSVQPGPLGELRLDSATFTPLPVYAGSTQTVAADATSGIFYTVMGHAPELYRTLDYGGTWQPVPMRYEDPDTGLNRSAGALDSLAVSSVSGEVAVATNAQIPGCCGGTINGGLVHFSTDYGLTWRTVTGLLPFQGPQRVGPRFLHWGHAGSSNVMIVAQTATDGTSTVWRADMSAAQPAWVREPTDPFGQGSFVAGAHSGDGSFLGRVTASGDLSFARLTATGPISFGPPEATGLPSPPSMLRLGGAREASAPPDGALVLGGSGPPYSAQMLTKSAGAQSFAGGSFSAPTPVPTACRYIASLFDQGTGSVAPTTTGNAGSGSVGQCWVAKPGTGSLTFYQTCCEARDISYDSNWGAGNLVLLRAGSSGLMKAARLDANGVPDFNHFVTAMPGSDSGSGGLSVVGIVSPVVEDTVYGAAGAQQLAVAVWSAGGQLSLASRDGGQSFVPILPRGWGAKSVQWWQGASGEWLVFGHQQGRGGRNLLSAVLGWDGAGSLDSPNVSGSRQQDLGGPPDSEYAVQSLHAVPGTDTVLIGLGTGFDPVVDSGNHLYRARIVPGSPPSLADVFSFDGALGATTLYLPQALAYCPSSSADARMRDVLFVATGDFGGLVGEANTKGSLLRITGTTSATPAVSEIASIPHGTPHTVLSDVRADCARGVVYTGGEHHLYKSTDAGLAFTDVPILSSPDAMGNIGSITAVGLNPADPDDVQVAAGMGWIARSANGGSTWTVVNDPAVRRPAPVHDIEFPPAGAALSGVRMSAATPRPAVLGTSSGAFRADLSVPTGVIALTAGRAGAQISALSSDSHPASTVIPRSGAETAVFSRSNGLYQTSTPSGRDAVTSWSIPMQIPRTVRGDFPAAALEPRGLLNVAFARRGAAAGIYVTRRGASGAWATPRRVSNRAGDTLPAIAIASNGTVHVAFLRTRGVSRGIYVASSSRGRWTGARKLRGTRAVDASTGLGGPSIAARGSRIHLAFARSGRASGIYYALRRGSRWSAPRRLTRARDVQPALAVDAYGVRNIVFRRRSGRRGLFALRWERTRSVARIPGTLAADTEPALSASGSTVILAFARPTGTGPGVYYDSTRSGGRWLPKPRRWSQSSKDRNPSVRADARGRVTIVFERG